MRSNQPHPLTVPEVLMWLIFLLAWATGYYEVIIVLTVVIATVMVWKLVRCLSTF